MIRVRHSPKMSWGEPKKNYNLALTATASNILESMLEELRISRSEILERAIRHPEFARLVNENKPPQGEK
jgi:hypothetical protein